MNFDSIKRTLNGLFVALTIFMASPTAMAFDADTTALNGSLTGLWNNADQPGWGAAITHQYGMIFATFYTYDNAGNPTWYVASVCPVSGSGCTGPLYTVTGGTNPIDVWNAPNKIVTQVGTMTFTFTDANTGTMSYSINGSNGIKTITKSLFASPPGGGPYGSLTITGSSLIPSTFLPTTDQVTLSTENSLIVTWVDATSVTLTGIDIYSNMVSGNPAISIQFTKSDLKFTCSSGFARTFDYVYPYADLCNGLTFDSKTRTVSFSNVKLQAPQLGPVISLNGKIPY